MNPIKRFKQWLAHRKAVKEIVRRIRTETDLSLQAQAIYEYIRLMLVSVQKDKAMTLGQYEEISALILGNVVMCNVNRQGVNDSFHRIMKYARESANRERKEMEKKLEKVGENVVSIHHNIPDK